MSKTELITDCCTCCVQDRERERGGEERGHNKLLHLLCPRQRERGGGGEGREVITDCCTCCVQDREREGGEREVITDCCARCVQDRAHNRLLHLLCPRQRERERGGGGGRS